MGNVAVLWDIENVSPANSNTLPRQIVEYAGNFGDIAAMLAVGDWYRVFDADTRCAFFDCGFELLYIPFQETGKRQHKNSSDIMLVAKATEMIFQLPHISTYVLVSGDGDFRPLMLQLKKHGKRSAIVCDARNAAEDLLKMADRYIDYRDLLQSDESDDSDKNNHPDNQGPTGENDQPETKLSENELYQLLLSAVRDIEIRGSTPNISLVKARMKLLNQDFPDHELKKKKWRLFLEAAQKNGYVSLESRGSDITIHTYKQPLPAYHQTLQDVFGSLDSDPEKWINLGPIGQYLRNKDINLQELMGISSGAKLKDCMIYAAKVGILETRNRGTLWEARLLRRLFSREHTNHTEYSPPP